MGLGPGGRAAVDEPWVNANWNEYASLVQLLITRLTRGRISPAWDCMRRSSLGARLLQRASVIIQI